MTLKPIAAFLIACGMLVAQPALAAGPMSAGAYRNERGGIKAEYEADVERCSSLSGNAKDLCRTEAGSKRNGALADAEAAYKGTPKAHTDALFAHAEANYAVAREKCDDFAGNAKDVCVMDAKAVLTKAKADAKAKRVATDARSEAIKETRDADYDAAKARCDALAGDAKDRCIADAKSRFGRS
ncbi:MAG: hypothetical protein ACRET8_07755 [Burkholderiales bacterium]